MARIESNMMPLGTQAPSFELLDTVTNTSLHLNTLKGEKGTVITFICNHCPFVIHINKALTQLANSYITKGFNFIAISSNDVQNYPQDAPHLMKEQARNEAYPFPYLYDATQEVAQAYEATCTPDFYLFDSNMKLVYRGQFDDSRPGNGLPVTGNDLKKAMDALLDGTPINPNQKPSIGCGIKWFTN